MSRPFVESLDSSVLERRFSNEDRLSYFREADPEDIAAAFEAIQPHLARLPKREQDLLFMHFIMKKKQTELGVIFNRTQAAISYRIKKAISRLKFLLSIPDVDEDDIRRDLTGLFDDNDVEIMVGMFRHTCQTQVARDMGSNQCYIRHRFHKNIKILKREMEYDDKYEPYHTLFDKIKNNTNILREVKLSRWDNGDYIIDDQL